MEQSNKKGNCNQLENCIELLNLILDKEATRDEEKFIKNHLEECSCCIKQFEIEKEFRMLLKSRLSHAEIPNDLIETIRSKIR